MRAIVYAIATEIQGMATAELFITEVRVTPL
jgi:hypothetical protein